MNSGNPDLRGLYQQSLCLKLPGYATVGKAVAVPWQSQWECHGSGMAVPWHWHGSAMAEPMAKPSQSNGSGATLPCAALKVPWQQHGGAMALRRHYHRSAMAMSCYCDGNHTARRCE